MLSGKGRLQSGGRFNLPPLFLSERVGNTSQGACEKHSSDQTGGSTALNSALGGQWHGEDAEFRDLASKSLYLLRG
jgi:hypothetical protein